MKTHEGISTRKVPEKPIFVHVMVQNNGRYASSMYSYIDGHTMDLDDVKFRATMLAEDCFKAVSV